MSWFPKNWIRPIPSILSNITISHQLASYSKQKLLSYLVLKCRLLAMVPLRLWAGSRFLHFCFQIGIRGQWAEGCSNHSCISRGCTKQFVATFPSLNTAATWDNSKNETGNIFFFLDIISQKEPNESGVLFLISKFLPFSWET